MKKVQKDSANDYALKYIVARHNGALELFLATRGR